MKRFLIRLLLFSVFIYIIALIFDRFISFGLQRVPKNHLETFNAIMYDTLNHDVLILGNSRGATAYHPYYLDSILECNSRNISVSGQTYRISDLRYRIYRRNNVPPRLVILNIDHIELSSGTLGFEREQYFPYIKDSLVKSVLDINHFTWMDKHIPMWRYKGAYKYIGIGLCEFLGLYHFKGKQYKGWTQNIAPWNGANFEYLLETDGQINCSINDTVVDIFDNLLNQLQYENVQAVMVYSPMYIKALENMSPTFDTIMEVYTKMSQKYDVPILDYRTLPMNSDTAFFVDATHLNYKGAELFTTKLAHDIDSIGLLK